MTITLNTPCYTVQSGQVIEGTLNDFRHYIETTTRPTGVGSKYYSTSRDEFVVIRADGSVYHTFYSRESAELHCDSGEGEKIEERTVWYVAEWVTWGGPERVVRYCDSEEHARKEVEAIHVNDILNNNEITIYLTREEAQADLISMEDDQQ